MNFAGPIPRAGMPQYSEASNLRSPRDGDSTGKQWIKERQVAAQMTHVENALALMQQQINMLRKRSVGGAGWQWADPPEYDSTKRYQPDQVVIVGSTNPAVTDGVNSGADFAEPGIYVCVNKTGNTGTIHPPKPQPDPATDSEGHWLASVYWVALGAGGGSPCSVYG